MRDAQLRGCVSSRPTRTWVRVLLLFAVGILASSLTLSALAAPRDEAKRHFKAGMELIAGGDIDAGVAELEVAYDILPHPNVLFNIGRAFTEAGRQEEALTYFRRYVESGPPDAADVQALIYQIEEELALAQREAEKPEIEMIEGEVSAEQMKMLMDLADRLERVADKVETGGPRTGGGGFGLSGDELGADELLTAKGLESVYEEQVVSASRQATSPVDAPVSTHIVTQEDIRMAGLTSIPDILRQVPGIELMTMSSSNHNVAIRGMNQRMANKVLVLVDGRSVYLDALGNTFWKSISVNPSDIDRIEVIRGPGATLYGANAFSGVVNIITKPIGEKEAQFGIIGGMGETIGGDVRYSDRIKTVGYSMSVGYEQTDRYEMEYDPERADITTAVTDPTLATRAIRANAGINWLPRRDTSIGLRGGLTHGLGEFYAIGLLRDYYWVGTFPWLRFDMRHKGLSTRVFWNNTSIQSYGPFYYVPGTLDSLYGGLKANVIDAEASYSSDVMLGIPHNISVGVGFRVKTINGFEPGTEWGYIDDNYVERHLNAFIEDRITFWQDNETFDSMALVLGFRFDQHPLVGFTPSPRVALIAKPTESMAIRASAGTAFRIPTFMESYLDLRVPGPAAGVELITMGNRDLAPEQIRSVEVGYRFEGSDFFMFDVAAYYQRVNNLIALGSVQSAYDYGIDVEEQPTQYVAGVSQWENIDQPFGGFGIEPSVHVFPVDGLDISANYSMNLLYDVEKYKDDPDTARDERGPVHKINAGVQYRSPFYLDFGVSMSYVSAYSVPERTFDDGGNTIVEQLEIDPYVILNARIILRLLDDKLNIGVTGQNLTAFGKEGGHREHEFGQHVGPRVYGSLSYKF